MGEWKEVRLGEVIDFKNGRKKPNNSGVIPIYGGNGILGYTDINNNDNTVAIGRVGAYCGSVYYEKGNCWISDNAISAKPYENNDVKFTYYLLKYLKLNERRIGTGQPLLTQGILNDIEVLYPNSYQEQKAIANTLSALDDKIELNNKINKTLEEMAQAIFKSWFVDFEPFQNCEIEDSELGKIPKGWRVGTLDEIIDIHDSKRIPLSSRQRDNMEKIYPYYGAASLMDYVDNYIFNGIYVLLGEDGTVIDNEGYPILQYVWGKFWVNNHAHVLTGKNGFSNESLYMILKNTNIQGIVTGAVQLKTNQANLKSLKIVIPTNDIVKKYSYLLEPIFAEIRRTNDENQRLIAIRDSLLPKLMSGEIRVPVEESI